MINTLSTRGCFYRLYNKCCGVGPLLAYGSRGYAQGDSATTTFDTEPFYTVKPPRNAAVSFALLRFIPAKSANALPSPRRYKWVPLPTVS